MMKHLTGWVVAATAVVLMAVPAVQAGRLAGPGSDTTVVSPFSSITYTERFEGDEAAVVTIKGDGDTVLTVDVYDQSGNFIDSDVGVSCQVRWVPRWTGKFKIVVNNLGDESNQFRLKTN